eukprot:7363472-Prymnesium_polylepis.1
MPSFDWPFEFLVLLNVLRCTGVGGRAGHMLLAVVLPIILTPLAAHRVGAMRGAARAATVV